MNQRDIFLKYEGDNWFKRNQKVIKKSFPELKFLTKYLKAQSISKFLEIGCSSGMKTKILARKLNAEGYGLDPSKLAIKQAKKNFPIFNKLFRKYKVKFEIGTCDLLPYNSAFFDFIYFSFCLYLVDRNLISNSLNHADRCLKPGGFIAIKDFDYGEKNYNLYKHHNAIFTFKDDYTNHFLNLGYRLVSKESYIKQRIGFDMDPNQRVSIWLLIKPE